MALHFNQELQNKYPHLEVSVLKMSEVKENNENFRIDSEPFKKSNLITNQYFDYVKLSDIALINPSKTEISNLNLDTEVSFISMQNLGTGNINDRETGTIKDYRTGYTYFAENDILIAKITPCMEHGKCAIAINLKNKIGFGSTEYNVFRITDERFIKEFVFCFLNRENIRKIAADNMIGTSGRQRVPTNFYENLLIPFFPLEFQQQIEQMVRESHECLEQSKGLYREAEVLLYRELGLDPENPLASIEPHSGSLNISVRPLSQSLNTTGRLDSEYYQQKYDEIEKVIKNYRGGYFQLSLSKLRDKNFTPQAQTKYRYIELANIGTNGNISEPIVDFGENLPSRARRIVKTGDMIISSVEGSLQSCALITDEFDNCIVSTGFYVLKSSNLNSETLLVLFKSKLFQDYLHKFSSGTILTAISKDELQNILIPKIAQQTQTQIAEKIKQSFTLRKKANELLQQAKSKVETAIEQPSF